MSSNACLSVVVIYLDLLVETEWWWHSQHCFPYCHRRPPINIFTHCTRPMAPYKRGLCEGCPAEAVISCTWWLWNHPRPHVLH